MSRSDTSPFEFFPSAQLALGSSSSSEQQWAVNQRKEAHRSSELEGLWLLTDHDRPWYLPSLGEGCDMAGGRGGGRGARGGQDSVEYDGGLRLRGAPLWLDARRPVPQSFLSNALAFRHHQRLITSPETVTLLDDELGNAEALASPLGRRFSVGELVLELLPAGSVVGSSMLLVHHLDLDVLYCGAVRLGAPWLGEPAQIRKADVVVLDCPYDDRSFDFPERSQTGRTIVEWARQVLNEGGSPVLVASAFGMAQELCQLAASADLEVRVDRTISRWNRRVRACGVPLTKASEIRGELRPGKVAIMSNDDRTRMKIARHAPKSRVALVSGRAVLERAVEEAGAEVGFPLSCHADAADLRQLVRDTGAKTVYLGPRHTEPFEESLRRGGLDVTRFVGSREVDQLDLFS